MPPPGRLTCARELKKGVSAARGLSEAELVRACEHAAKDAILARRMSVETSELAAALMQRRAAQA